MVSYVWCASVNTVIIVYLRSLLIHLYRVFLCGLVPKYSLGHDCMEMAAGRDEVRALIILSVGLGIYFFYNNRCLTIRCEYFFLFSF